jgi:hypothetical protein
MQESGEEVMFDIEFLLKAVALVVAIGLLLSSIDVSYLLTKLFVKESKPVVDTDVAVDNGNKFLATMELWFLLKKKCDESSLTAASKKMDEVFPLLNDNIEEK